MKFNEIQLPSNRKFGFFFSIFFLLLSVYLHYHELGNANIVSFFLSLTFFAAAILKPILLMPLNRLWMLLGFIIGRIISPIVLGIIFFGMFSPISFLTRIFGRDELLLAKQKKKSYWEIRSEARHSFKNQF